MDSSKKDGCLHLPVLQTTSSHQPGCRARQLLGFYIFKTLMAVAYESMASHRQKLSSGEMKLDCDCPATSTAEPVPGFTPRDHGSFRSGTARSASQRGYWRCSELFHVASFRYLQSPRYAAIASARCPVFCLASLGLLHASDLRRRSCDNEKTLTLHSR
jgi:hypothetical protein